MSSSPIAVCSEPFNFKKYGVNDALWKCPDNVKMIASVPVNWNAEKLKLMRAIIVFWSEKNPEIDWLIIGFVNDGLKFGYEKDGVKKLVSLKFEDFALIKDKLYYS